MGDVWSARLRAAAVAFLLLAGWLVSPSGSALTAAPPGTRAMWVWGYPSADEVIPFAQAHGVSTLFVTVAPTVATDGDLPRLQRFKLLADAANIRLLALGGDPNWTTDHASALAWQRAALGTGLFAGSHVDVEPYSLPAWSTDQAGTVSNYLSLLSTLQADSPLPLEADVPFWYGTIAAPGYASLADAVLARVDEVSVMSYRDTGTGTNSIFAVGTDWLQRGANAGKPVRLGAETNPLSDCPTCTFYGQGEAALGNALSLVDGAAAAYPDYAGISVEDYYGWLALAGAPAPAPTVKLMASRTSVGLGGHVWLAWSSQNAVSCQASGAWSGARALSGSYRYTAWHLGTMTFSLSCVNSAAVTSTESVRVTVP